MENQELTVADVCLYPNAKIKTRTFTCNLRGISIHTNELVLSEIVGIDDMFITNVSDCKLILKSIEDMSKDECIFIYETIIGKSISSTRYIVEKNKTGINIETIYNLDYDDKANVFIPYSLEIYYTQEGKVNNVDGERMKIIIDYLRSICIDVDNYIETDKAVKSHE